MLHIVPFHVEASKAAADRIEQACSAFDAARDYVRLLDILFMSSRLHDPQVSAAVLTDEATEMTLCDGRVQILRSAINPDQVIFSRLVAQIEFLKRSASGDDVAFLDSDMIINAPLGPVFDEDFDLALTYRENAEMPINGGIILVSGKGRPAAIRFLERVKQCFASQFSNQLEWWGDQRALIEVLGRQRFIDRTGDRLEVDGVRIRLLPCDKYNFSPKDRLRAIALPLRGKAILHFKGERKRLMPLYWDAYLANRHQPSRDARWRALRTRLKLLASVLYPPADRKASLPPATASPARRAA